MSVRLMAAVFESDRLAPTERLLMLALADHADDQGLCYPSIDRLCQRTGLSRRAVQINIQKLQDQGYLIALKGGGRGHSSRYQINVNPAPDALFKDIKGAPETPNEMHRFDVKGAFGAIKGASGARKGAPDAPEPSRTVINLGGGGCARAREADFSDPKPDLTEREELLVAMGHDRTGLTATGRLLGTEIDMAEARRWAELGLSHDQQLAVIREVMATKRDGAPNSFKFFRQPMQRVAAAIAEPPLQAVNQQARGQPPTGRQAIDVAAILAAVPDPD